MKYWVCFEVWFSIAIPFDNVQHELRRWSLISCLELGSPSEGRIGHNLNLVARLNELWNIWGAGKGFPIIVFHPQRAPLAGLSEVAFSHGISLLLAASPFPLSLFFRTLFSRLLFFWAFFEYRLVQASNPKFPQESNVQPFLRDISWNFAHVFNAPLPSLLRMCVCVFVSFFRQIFGVSFFYGYLDLKESHISSKNKQKQNSSSVKTP